MNNKKYLITGAGGFIGKALLNTMKQKKFNVDGLDNFKFSKKTKDKIINCDILNKKKLEKIVKKYDIIIHLAAVDSIIYFKNNLNQSYKINVTGSENLIKSLSKKQKLYFFSSNQVYGETKYLPIDERHTTHTEDPYGISKLIVENMIKINSLDIGFEYCIIRNFNTFGPNQNINSLIPSLINSALKENKIEIWSGNSVRDFQYIDDLVKNFLFLNKSKNNGQTINFASGKPAKMSEIASLISKETGCKLVVFNKKKFFVKKYSSVKKLKTIIGHNFKRLPIKNSLISTIDFYRKKIEKNSYNWR